MKKQNITEPEAKRRLFGYIKKYYCGVREELFDSREFKRQLHGYVVSLTHYVCGDSNEWQVVNHRHALRKYLDSYALNQIDILNRNLKIKTTIYQILTFGSLKTKQQFHKL